MMNWGWRIFFLTAGFVLFVFFMVYKAMQQDFHLVYEDYYDKEIKYQGEIDRIKNAKDLKDGLKIEYLLREDKIKITYPPEHKNSIKGAIYLFRPSDSALDTSFPIESDRQGVQIISVSSLKNGLWQVKINWTFGDKEYQQEKNLVLQ
jgi:hypothetical protein